MFAMNKKILAISISAVLALAFVLPAINANALTSAENKALKTILDLTTSAKDKLANNVQPTLTTVKQDLQFKQKFWQFEPFQPTFPVFGVGVFGICTLSDQSACAFNVESIQIRSTPGANVIAIDVIPPFPFERTFISPQSTPTNLLVDTGHGQVGTGGTISLVGAVFDRAVSPTFEFSGEKPQGMIMERAFLLSPAIGGATAGSNTPVWKCMDAEGKLTDCSAP